MILYHSTYVYQISNLFPVFSLNIRRKTLLLKVIVLQGYLVATKGFCRSLELELCCSSFCLQRQPVVQAEDAGQLVATETSSKSGKEKGFVRFNEMQIKWTPLYGIMDDAIHIG